ncbi:hypothetical protein [Sediminivirga luteola]|uniref:hypothetical protein n=1 Tax=Sediminivirga luteola TaxID=1774748 RepID=UPI00166CC3F4|nr:hypothetical protein [Sediminivirga luteola]
MTDVDVEPPNPLEDDPVAELRLTVGGEKIRVLLDESTARDLVNQLEDRALDVWADINFERRLAWQR